MAYELNKYNGTYFASVDDQTLNTTATDLRFVGRNYSGYGEVENENFLHLLENFANTSAPPRAIGGQLWFDTSVKKLKVYDGARFKVAGSAESSSTAPAGFAVGDFWWDNQNEQIKVWNGTAFILVGPEKAPTYGATSTAPAVVKDLVGSDKQIIKFQVGGEVIAIIASRAFTLNSVINPITGFYDLRQGINFINSDALGVTSSAHRFWGTAANSERLGGYTVDNFLRTGTTSFSSQITFADSGVAVGDQLDLRISVANGSVPVIESYRDSMMVLRISDQGTNIKDIAVIKPTGIEPGQTNQYYLGTASAKWKGITAETINATTFYGKFVGEIQSVNNGTPLNFNSVVISGAFNHSSATDNFNISLSGTATATLTSGSVGSINNFNIGTTTRGTAAFTSLTANSPVTFTNTNAASSTTTGALVVSGGAGISGPLYVGGDSKFTSTGGLGVPVGTTAQRSGAPSVGMIRFNTTLGEWEGWDGVEWRFIGGDANEDYGLITSTSNSFVDYGGITGLT